MSHKPYHGHENDTCPRRGGRLCSEICPTCAFQTEIKTVKPNRTTVSIWACADVLAVAMLVEHGGRMNELAASIQSFRNEVVEQNKQALSGAVILAQRTIDGLLPNG